MYPITLNNQKSLLLSGAMHHFRSSPQLWPELMRQARDAGLNSVETYSFWGLHEPVRGQYDFSGYLNVRRWCDVAQEHGLGVIFRPGPYICGEVNYGGFPAWLRDVPGIRFRTKNQPYYDEVRRWFDRLFEEVGPCLSRNGGPIFMVQVENEYRQLAHNYGEDGVAYLEWLRDLLKSYDLGVPLSMCNWMPEEPDGLGWVPGTLETINHGNPHPLVRPFKKRYPEDPCLWTEAWTAWYQIFGGPERQRSASNLAFYVGRFFAEGGKGINYYMWHGGTNFGRSPMFLITPCYDFGAPLDEFGQPTPKYDLLAGLHKALAAHTAALLETELPQVTELADKCFAFEYPHPTDPLVFLSNDGYVEASAPAQDVEWQGKRYHLPAETLLLVGKDGVLWQTTVTNEPDERRHEIVPNTEPLQLVETLSATVPSFDPAGATEPQPLEQLQYTRDVTDYCWYLTIVEVPQSGEIELQIEGVADFFQVFIDGERVASSESHLPEDRGPIGAGARRMFVLGHKEDAMETAKDGGPVEGAGFRQSVRFSCQSGRHEVAILVSALGLVKGDWNIEANMADERKGIWGRVLLGGGELTGPWQMRAFDPASTADFAAAETGSGQLSWHRFAFPAPGTDRPVVLDLATMQKGLAWLNGRCLTRYWLVSIQESKDAHLEHDQLQTRSGEEPSQRYYHVPHDWLREENELILFDEFGGDPQGVRLCEVTPKM